MTDSATTATRFSDTLAKFEDPAGWNTLGLIEDAVTRLLSIDMPEDAATLRAMQGAIEAMYTAMIALDGVGGNRTLAMRSFVSTFVDVVAIEFAAAGPVNLNSAGIEKDPDNRTRRPGDVCDYCPTVGLAYEVGDWGTRGDTHRLDQMVCPSCGMSWNVDPTATIGGDQ